MRGMNIKGTDIPLEVLHQHVAVLGKTGSGKSSVLRLLVESQSSKELCQNEFKKRMRIL